MHVDTRELYEDIKAICPEALYIMAQECSTGYKDGLPLVEYRALVDFGPNMPAITIKTAPDAATLTLEIAQQMATIRAGISSDQLARASSDAFANITNTQLEAMGGGDVVLGADGKEVVPLTPEQEATADEAARQAAITTPGNPDTTTGSRCENCGATANVSFVPAADVDLCPACVTALADKGQFE